MKILFLFFFVIDFVTVVELCIDFYLFYYINIYKNTNKKVLKLKKLKIKYEISFNHRKYIERQRKSSRISPAAL